MNQKLSLIEKYHKYIKDNSYHSDQAQEEIISKLNDFANAISNAINMNNAIQPYNKSLGSFWHNITNLFTGNHEKQAGQIATSRFTFNISPVKGRFGENGIYLYGGVGRGKSMIMDMFFEHVNLPADAKNRIHFHKFMADVHEFIHDWRQNHQDKSNNDPIIPLADKISSQYKLICFDEFQVHDVADAMLLSRLFRELFNRKMLIIFTSNRHPEDLYQGGLQRERFLEFVALVEKKLHIIELKSDSDYRLKQIKSLEQSYFHPLGLEADKFIRTIWKYLTKDQNIINDEKISLPAGRNLKISLMTEDIARFSFDELCRQPLGSNDYLAIANQFDIIIIENIPMLSAEERNEAKRFVNLIDALYESKTKLICSAANEPNRLYKKGTGVFEFQRTISRLYEMQSAKWQEQKMELVHISD